MWNLLSTTMGEYSSTLILGLYIFISTTVGRQWFLIPPRIFGELLGGHCIMPSYNKDLAN